MTQFKNRLMQYGALAAAIPAAGAQAGIVAQTGLNVALVPGQSALFDFGPGFGEVFRFEVRSGSSSEGTSAGAFFQFNPNNSGSVEDAGIVAIETGASGGRFINNDPAQLAFDSYIGVERTFFEPMSSYFGTLHDLVNQFNSFPARANTNGSSNWSPDSRGYIGFKMFKGGSFHFGWFDVESLYWNDGGVPVRGAVQPTIIIHGWGFQDEFRAPIKAGEVPAPAAGGLLALALGAAGIRRSRQLAQVA